MPLPTVGRIVHYLLSEEDVARILDQLSHNPPDVSAQFNEPRLGQPYAAMVTSVNDHPVHSDVNLSVWLDGPANYFAPSRREGTQPGTWCWPPRVGA